MGYHLESILKHPYSVFFWDVENRMKTEEEHEHSEHAVSVVAATRCDVGTGRTIAAETPGARSFDWGPPPGS